MLFNGYGNDQIIKSTLKEAKFGHYSMHNIEAAITAGKKLTKAQLESSF